MNFPWLAYMDIVEDQQLSIDDYTKGVYWIEFWADLLNSIFRHSKENFTLKEYIAPFLAENKTFAVWSGKDLVPFLK